MARIRHLSLAYFLFEVLDTEDAWSHRYGGVDDRAGCAGLPSHPAKDEAMSAAGDDLISLREYCLVMQCVVKAVESIRSLDWRS